MNTTFKMANSSHISISQLMLPSHTILVARFTEVSFCRYLIKLPLLVPQNFQVTIV